MNYKGVSWWKAKIYEVLRKISYKFDSARELYESMANEFLNIALSIEQVLNFTSFFTTFFFSNYVANVKIQKNQSTLLCFFAHCPQFFAWLQFIDETNFFNFTSFFSQHFIKWK